MDLAENQPLCCLCCLSVPLDHRRRKKFNGTGCMKSKATLEKISSTPLDFFVETSHPNAVLCSTCEKLLINISKLEEKLQILKLSVQKSQVNVMDKKHIRHDKTSTKLLTNLEVIYQSYTSHLIK